MSNQKKINAFAKEYLDPRLRVEWNRFKFTNVSDEHLDMCYNICKWFYKQEIPFAMETTFKSGYNPDIIVPTWIKPIIEVRHSETNKRTLEKYKRIPDELHDEIIFVDASQPFSEKLIQ